MSADRLRAEVPPVVTAAVGMIVAVVSGVFGMSAHGLAAGLTSGMPVAPPSSADVLLVGAASAGVGAVTAALARYRSPLVVAAGALLTGQGLVHLILSTGHTHQSAGRDAQGHHVLNAAAVRAAMDGVGGGASAGSTHIATLFTPQMMGAHIAAIVLTLALVAVLSRALAWVAARVAPLLATTHLVVVVPLLASYNAHAPRARYLLTGGGTRAPPAIV